MKNLASTFLILIEYTNIMELDISETESLDDWESLCVVNKDYNNFEVLCTSEIVCDDNTTKDNTCLNNVNFEWHDEIIITCEDTKMWNDSKINVVTQQPKNKIKKVVIEQSCVRRNKKKQNNNDKMVKLTVEESIKKKEDDLNKIKEADMENTLDLFSGLTIIQKL